MLYSDDETIACAGDFRPDTGLSSSSGEMETFYSLLSVQRNIQARQGRALLMLSRRLLNFQIYWPRATPFASGVGLPHNNTLVGDTMYTMNVGTLDGEPNVISP
jgi:hypothetical protein